MKYDIVIMGGGIGGCTAATESAKQGLRTAIIEMNEIGGVCLNKGCIPMKKSKIIAMNAQNSYGANWEGIAEQIQSDVTELRLKMEKYIQGLSIDLYRGQSSFVNDHTVVVGDSILEAEYIIIATGSRPIVPKCLSDLPRLSTIDDFVSSFPTIPKDVVIIGAGISGIELAYVLQLAGTDSIVIVEQNERILSSMWSETERIVERQLYEHGIELIKGVQVTTAEEDMERVFLFLDNGDVLETGYVITACGRKENTNGLRLENTGVKIENNRIITDERHCTAVKNIFAVGDVAGKMKLAYLAAAQARNVICEIVGKAYKKAEQIFPQCLSLWTSIGVVGKSETLCLQENIKVKKQTYSACNEGAWHIAGDVSGIIYMVFREDNHQIQGAMVCAENDTEQLINLLTIVINQGMTMEDLAAQVFFHPSYSEAIAEAADLSEIQM